MVHIQSFRREDVSAAEVTELARTVERGAAIFVIDDYLEDNHRKITVREKDLIVRALRAFT